MEEVFIDIRNENETIQGLFNKDYVSIDDLLNKLDSLAEDIEYLNDKIRELENPASEEDENW